MTDTMKIYGIKRKDGSILNKWWVIDDQKLVVEHFIENPDEKIVEVEIVEKGALEREYERGRSVGYDEGYSDGFGAGFFEASDH